MMLNPLTYGMAALRRCLYLATPAAAGPVPPLGISLVISVIFCLVAFTFATRSASRTAAH
jgi:ABC-type polysaccharide/polyol phosphate export permease